MADVSLSSRHPYSIAPQLRNCPPIYSTGEAQYALLLQGRENKASGVLRCCTAHHPTPPNIPTQNPILRTGTAMHPPGRGAANRNTDTQAQLLPHRHNRKRKTPCSCPGGPSQTYHGGTSNKLSSRCVTLVSLAACIPAQNKGDTSD